MSWYHRPLICKTYSKYRGNVSRIVSLDLSTLIFKDIASLQACVKYFENAFMQPHPNLRLSLDSFRNMPILICSPAGFQGFLKLPKIF
jgi:hypothetical protein